MTGQAVPLFEAGNLLTKEMLSALKDYSFGFSEYLYQGYSDGCLAGCRITTTKSILQLNQGIFLYQGRLYLIQNPLVKEYHPTDQETAWKLRMKDDIRTKGFIYREMDTILTEDLAEKDGEIELCRFKLQEGFQLRITYKNFTDRSTLYDTVNVIHAPFAAYGDSSISPEITLHFAKNLMMKKDITELDQIFCIQVFESHGKALNRSTITTYLCGRLSLPFKRYTSIELFQYLDSILQDTVYVPKIADSGSTRRKVLV